jgi:hypothetical protein
MHVAALASGTAARHDPGMKLIAMLGVVTAMAAEAGMKALPDRLVFEGGDGPGRGRHVVLVSGDEEYRSEESMPMLAAILAERHGFTCTVLFALDPDGTVNPANVRSLPGSDALQTADVIVLAVRFRCWPDEAMKDFVDAYLRGVPIVALRTSTHAFNYPKDSTSPYAKYGWNRTDWPGGFGRQVLGETWVAHHGKHKVEGTRGVVEPGAEADPVFNGVAGVFGDTDVYTANPPPDCRILLRGQVTQSLDPASPPVEGAKNAPMQPVVWIRQPTNEAGRVNGVLCTTMGSATDLANEGLRRLVVNGVFRGAGLPVPAKADVAPLWPYRPTFYGFGTFRKGLKPEAFARPSP